MERSVVDRSKILDPIQKTKNSISSKDWIYWELNRIGVSEKNFQEIQSHLFPIEMWYLNMKNEGWLRTKEEFDDYL